VHATLAIPETLTILLVEDNPADARLIREMLVEEPAAGIELEWESTLASALERAQRGGVSAVLLDLTLPDGSGLGTLHAVCRELPHMPIIVLTGLADDVLADGAMRAGAQDYLVKGRTDSATLVRSIRYSIERNRSEALRVKTEHELEDYRTRLEDMVAQRTAELLATNVQLEEALAARSRFLASVSHELRTPLNSIIGFSHILLTDAPGPTTEEQHRQLEMIHTSGEHLLELINQVLDLTRIDQGHHDLAIAPFDPATVAAEVIDTLEPLARSRGNALFMECENGRVGPLVSDESKVRQVLLNLVGNAVKYTEGGTITVKVGCEGLGVRFTVTDTGAGIPPETLKRVFQEFERGDVMDLEGSGLGLAIARALVGALGGDIEGKSVVGSGSTFAFLVPELTEAAAPAARSTSARPSASEAQNGHHQ
jgi:signal transduction histidine kinase